MSLQLTTEQLNRLFPFFIQLNRQLIITACGSSVKKISTIKTGSSFTDFFEIIRPGTEIINDSSIHGLQNQLVILQSVTPPSVKLRGQFEITDTGDYLFLGSPWISGMHELKKMGLLLSDFSYHDPLIDLLHVIKTMEIANEDIKEIVTIYNEQRIQLKQALKEKEEMAMFAMQSPFPFFRIDTNGSILVQNPASEQLSGTIYYGTQKLSLNDFAVRFVQDLMQKKEQGPIIIKSNKRIYSLLSTYVADTGYFNVYANDITEQQLLQSEVINSANRLNTLITNLQSGVLLENENRTIALVNRQFCRLFGIPAQPEQLQGADCSDAAEQSKNLFKDPDAFVKRINFILKEARVIIGDKLELTDGRIYQRDFIPIWNENEYLGHLWVYNDITEEETAKSRIEEQRLFYEEILNNIPADIAVFDPEHRYLFLNPRAIANPELRSWLIGKTDKDYMELKKKPQAIATERSRFFRSVMESKELKSFEEELITPQGTKQYHLRNFYPVLDAGKNVSLVIGYGLNITERKLMEDELRKAKQETEQTAKAKEQFIATMSHEIRTPLNGIIGITELLEKTILSPAQKKQVELLKSSEDQLMRIVNEVLEYERIINGHVHLEETDFDVVKLINEIVKTFQPKAKEKKLLFTSSCNVAGLCVTGDPFRLKQVLGNLVSNALKFTKKGKVELVLAVKKTKNTKVLLSFSVIDTGIGIEKKHLANIFDPYKQEKASTSREFGGTGLGLAISLNLLKLFNSELKVTSNPRSGSTFSFRLQLPINNSVQPARKTEMKAGVMLPDPAQSLHVLIAEDDPMNQYIIKQTLLNSHIKCRIVNNGKEAIDVLRKEHFDLVLMDVEMPIMGGMDATVRIRKMKNKKLSQIPIIAITANAFKEDRQEYLRAGMNDCITKPFTQEQLLSVIAANSNYQPLKESSPAKTASTKQLFDLSYIKSLSTDPSFIEKSLAIFCTNSQELTEQLEHALQTNKLKEITAILHKLKSSAGVTGMQRTRNLILKTELDLKKKKLSKEAIKVMKEIIADFKECIQAIKGKSYDL